MYIYAPTGSANDVINDTLYCYANYFSSPLVPHPADRKIFTRRDLFACFRAPSDDAVLGDADEEDGGPRARLAEEGAAVRRRRRQEGDGDRRRSRAGQWSTTCRPPPSPAGGTLLAPS